MPPTQDPGPPGGGDTPKLSRWERMKYSLVRADDSDPSEAPEERPAAEVEADIRRANDKERAIGLVAAPVAAALAFIIDAALISNDPKTGPKHVDPSLYHSLLFVMLGLSALILVTALWRKRLFLGMALALYGLATFNLHYWGFGVPFLLAGAWYLVRAYRLQQELKKLDAGGPAPGRKSAPPTNGSRPRRNKRYTPPT